MQNPDDALERIRECRLEAPTASILLLSMRMDDVWVAQAIDAGVDACLSKSTPLPTIGYGGPRGRGPQHHQRHAAAAA